MPRSPENSVYSKREWVSVGDAVSVIRAALPWTLISNPGASLGYSVYDLSPADRKYVRRLFTGAQKGTDWFTLDSFLTRNGAPHAMQEAGDVSVETGKQGIGVGFCRHGHYWKENPKVGCEFCEAKVAESRRRKGLSSGF